MSSSSATVVVATGENYPDALTASFLAGFLGSPLLITPHDRLSPFTTSALSAEHAQHAIVLGASLAVDDSVVTQLGQAGLQVTRIGGADRYDTARMVDEAPGTSVGVLNGQRTALVAVGTGFADALAAGPIAYAKHFPIVLTDGQSLSSSARAALTDLSIKQVVIIGGTLAVSSAVEDQIHQLGITTLQRLAGADRSDTAAQLARFAMSQLGTSADNLVLARGDDFPDALAAGPVAGSANAVALLSADPTDLGQASADFLQSNGSTIRTGRVAGGPLAISDDVKELAQALSGPLVLKSNVQGLAVADLDGASLSSDGATLTIPNPTNADTALRVGNVVLAGRTAQLPSGLLASVTATASSGSALVLTLHPASFGDVIESGAVYFQQRGVPEQLRARDYDMSTSASLAVGPCSVGSDVPIDFSGSSAHADNPQFEFTPRVGLDGLHAHLAVGVHVNVTVHARATNAGVSCEAPVPGLALDIAAGDIDIAGRKIGVTAKVGLFLDASFTVANLNVGGTFDVSPRLDMTAHNLSVEAGVASAGHPTLSNVTFDPSGQYQFRLETVAKVEVSIGGVGGDLHAGGFLDWNFGGGLPCDVSVGAEGGAGISAWGLGFDGSWATPSADLYQCHDNPSAPGGGTTSGAGSQGGQSGGGTPPSPPADGDLVRLPTGDIFRIAGGAPLHITSCDPFNGCAGAKPISDLSAFADRPADGTFLRAAESGNVFRVAGGAPLYLSSCAPLAGCPNTRDVNDATIAGLDHLNSRPNDGTFIRGADSQRIYRIVGGAPVYLPTCAPVNNCPGDVDVTQATIDRLDHLNGQPADGAFIRGADSQRIYRIAGGAPLYVNSCAPLGNCPGSVDVPQASIDSLDHMRPQPADGTFIRGADSQRIYRIAGGAPLYIAGNCQLISNCSPSVDVVQYTIDSLDHLLATPADGTSITGLPSGQGWTISGGCRRPGGGGVTVPDDTANSVSACGGTSGGGSGGGEGVCEPGSQDIPNPAPNGDGAYQEQNATLDVWVVAGGAAVYESNGQELQNMGYTSLQPVPAGTFDGPRYSQAPRDGTPIFDGSGPNIYVVLGGTPFYVSSPAEDQALGIQGRERRFPHSGFSALPSTPRDGTIVTPRGSGRTYVFHGGWAQTSNVCSGARVLTAPSDWVG